MERILRFVAAAAILVGGYIHFDLYQNKGYKTLPGIGKMFILNFVSAGLIALTLIFLNIRLTHLLAILWGVGTLAAFGITRVSTVLFSFKETGLNPKPQALIALIAEA